MSDRNARWRALRSGMRLTSFGKWFVLSSVVGIVAGLGGVAFQHLSDAAARLALTRVVGYVPREPSGETVAVEAATHPFSPGLLLLTISVGGLISGVIVQTFAPEAEGHGTDAAIEAFHHKRGVIRGRIPIVKMITSAVTIGTGGSGGREGPIAQIGAGFGSLLATRLKLSPRDRRILLAAGMGAGVGSIFRAPLAGALFAGEILYKDEDLESDVIIPSAIASIMGFTVFSAFLPAQDRFTPLFGNDLKFAAGSPIELLPLTLFPFVLVAVAIVYIKTFYGTRDLFAGLPVIPHVRPMIGAFLAGVCGLATYFAFGRDERALSVLATGYGTLQSALDGKDHLGVGLLLAIAGVKIVTTSLTISSGGSGGVFGPSMVIGGCLGAAVGRLLHDVAPALAPRPEIYAIVGMAGFFAGCAHAPISTIIMVSEMTGDYRLLLPTMWVSTLCFLLCRRWTLYEKQVASRLESPAHLGDFMVDLLEGIRVREVPLLPASTVRENMPMEEILRALPHARRRYFPVVDDGEKLVGIFSTDDVVGYVYEQDLWTLVLARDLMTTELLTVTPGDDLNTALKRFTQRNIDELPVVDRDDPSKLLGMIRRKDVIEAYNVRLLERKQAEIKQN